MAAGSAGYRPDIDGLRAIAVLAVILFHFFGQQLPGGYLGVDMFFVVSGFLITQIIQGEIHAGTFTLGGFYQRRVRRIVPALLVVLACSTVIAVGILLPSDLVRFGEALLATLAFGANIYAWLDTGYFSPLAVQKPLLHTWSLGVEEQFYILFPLLLVLIARRWPRFTLPAITLITVASFGLDLFARRSGANVAAFFLLPMRAWELGAGAIVALAPLHAAIPSRAMRMLCMALGLIAIGAALLAPENAQPPLYYAVFAVAGTALLLRFGQFERTPITRLLGAAPLVWIGLISYSLYLWHWPLIVFAKYWLVREPRPAETGALWLLMFVAAALTWRFVERPFRRRVFPARKLYAFSICGAGLLALTGIALLRLHGLPQRLDPAAALMNEAVGTHFRCALGDRVRLGAARGCALNLPSGDSAEARLVLFGNSHALMYAPAWRDILIARREPGALISMTGCLPTVSANFDIGCARLAQANLAALESLPHVQTVVLAMSWWHGPDEIVDAAGRRLDNRHHQAEVAAIDDLIGRLRARGKRVILVGPVAVPQWNVASDMSRLLAFGRPIERRLAVPRDEFAREYAAVFEHFQGRGDVTLARPDLVQCDDAVCPFVVDGRSLFSDSNHMTAAAVIRFRGIFTEALGP